MPDDIDRFCEQHWALNGISRNRQVEQRNVLRAFEDHVGRSLLEATGDDLSSFLASRVTAGRHVNTVRKYRGMILPFYQWAYRAKLVDRMRLLDMRDVRNPRGSTGRGTPQPYSRKELTEFWAALDRAYPLSDYYFKRWLAGRSKFKRIYGHAMRLQIDAIVALALYCGLRRGEILRSEINDIHPDNEYVVVRHPAQKGSGRPKPAREVPLTVGASERMRPWFDFLELLDLEHDRPWLSLYRQWAFDPMSKDRLATLLSGVEGDWRLHRFRHTCATLWLRNGMPLEHVKTLMGHANITETLAYAQVTPADVMRSALRVEQEFDNAIGREADATGA